MARTGIHSSDAKRYVLIAQFAGLGLGVLAAALWITEIPGLTRALPEKPAARSGLGDGPVLPTITNVAMIDVQAPLAMQERFDAAVRRPLVAPPPPDQKQGEQPPVVQSSGPAWRYLGAIRESTRTLALVSIDGAQKFLSVGSVVTLKTPAAEGRPESIYKATVTAVESDHIEIDESGKTRRIDLDARSSRVSWVKNMPAASTGTAMPTSAAMSAETRQRLNAQGIDPAAAERARIAAMNASLAAGRNRAAPNAPPGSDQAVLNVSNVRGAGGLAQPKIADDHAPPPNATSSRAGAKKTPRTDAEN